MSVAKVHTVAKARKDQGECESCRTPLPAGSPYRWFSVGFRSKFKHKRCTKPVCTPRPSQLESSKLADVYAAQEDAEDAIDSASEIDDITAAVGELGSAIREVADEYTEASTDDNGTVFNIEAQERAETLEAAADECDGWTPEAEDTEENVECDECDGTGDLDDDSPDAAPGDTVTCENCGGAGEVDNDDYDENWLDNAKDEAKQFINGLELP